MDMTRAILERVQEVELQITPEFQKDPGDEGVHVWAMHDALEKNGWVRDLDHEEGDTYTYHHPMLAGAAVRYSFSAHSGMVNKYMFMFPGEGSEPQRFDADPDMVEKMTKAWLKIEAKAVGEEKLPEIETVINMLTSLNWVTTSETMVFGGGGNKARVFAHPKVGKKIRVTYEPKTGDVINALVLKPDENPWESINSSPADIHQKAQELMKEAGA